MIGAYAQLACSMMLVGINVVVLKLLSTELPIATIIASRCALAALLLLPFVVRRLVWPGWAAMTNLAVQAALGSLAYNVLLIAGVRRTGALEAGLVLSALPVAVAILAMLLLRERLSLRQAVAPLLAVSGMAVLALGRGGVAHVAVIGDLLVLAAVLCEAGYVVLAKANSGRIGPLDGTFWMQASSALLMAPFAVLTWSGQVPSPQGLALLAFHSVTASLLAVVLWYAGLRRVRGSVAGVFAGLLPLSAGVASVLVLHESASLAQAAGAGLLLASLLLATWPGRQPPGTSRSLDQVAAPDRSISSSSMGANPSGDTPKARRA